MEAKGKDMETEKVIVDDLVDRVDKLLVRQGKNDSEKGSTGSITSLMDTMEKEVGQDKNVNLSEKLNTSTVSAECRSCLVPVRDEDMGLACQVCDLWYHAKCVGVGKRGYDMLTKSSYIGSVTRVAMMIV